MTMVLHDLVFLTDPKLDRLFSRGARGIVLGWIDQLLEMIAPPSTLGDALARHGLLVAFAGARRTDTVVKNWAYTYRFFGRPVPANVVALPRLRFVSQTHSTTEVAQLLERVDETADLGLRARLRDLIARSPVTELSRPDRHAPLRFGIASLQVLSDSALRGGIARQIAAAGEWPCANALGHALAAPELRALPGPLLAPVIDLLLDVHVTIALDTRLGARVPTTLDHGAARYAAVLPAFLASPLASRELGALDAGDRAVVERRAAKLRSLVPKDVLEEVVVLVARSRRPATSSVPAPALTARTTSSAPRSAAPPAPTSPPATSASSSASAKRRAIDRGNP
jgi:hypothetical protein